MSFLPTNTPLGVLEMVEVYEFFDEPCLFAAKNALDQLFLATLTSRKGTQRNWLYVPLSERRFTSVRSGTVELHDAFVSSESGFVWEIFIQGGETQWRLLASRELNDAQLPVEGEKLTIKSSTLPQLTKDDAVRIAQQENRDVYELEFDFPGMYQTEAPTKELGKLLLNFQETLDSIGKVKSKGKTKFKRLTPNLLPTETTVRGFKAASFVVELAASIPADLVGDSPTTDSFQEITELISIGADEARLHDKLTALSKETARKYRDFLKLLVATQSDLKVQWASPSPGRGGSADLPFHAASQALSIVEKVEAAPSPDRKVVGELVAVNLRTKYFELWEGGEKYSGAILPTAFPTIQHATLSQQYLATLREITERSVVTGEEKSKWQLVELEELPIQTPVPSSRSAS